MRGTVRKAENEMRILNFKIGKEQAGKSIGSILKTEMKLSSGLIARIKLVENGITLNGENVHTNKKVSAGDEIAALIGESAVSGGRLPYEILFEDEDILIINKPAGCAVHGSRYDDSVPSIEDVVNEYFGTSGMFHPVNRLDKGTTGVMSIAKNGYMHERLIEILHTGRFERRYVGIAEGNFAENEMQGCIDLPIARLEGSAIRRIVDENGSRAVTHYKVIKNLKGRAFVEFLLETGRTHQIRVHMAASGHPLTGDWLYGKEEKELIPRPCLHSESLKFIHPLTGKEIYAEADIPDDMKKLLNENSGER